jgi:hypothetical protein
MLGSRTGAIRVGIKTEDHTGFSREIIIKEE